MEPCIFTINQTYTIYHNVYPEMLGLSPLIALVYIVIPLCLMIEHYLLLKRKTNDMFQITTATEVIYECFGRHSVNKEVVNLILFEFCGYANPPRLEEILPIKEIIPQKHKELLQTDTARFILNPFRKVDENKYCQKSLLYTVLVYFTTACFVFLSFHGTILLVRTHEYDAKYSIHFRCELLVDTEDDVCKVIGYYDHGIWQNETAFNHDILLPYEPMNGISNNSNVLYLSLKGVDILTSIVGNEHERKIDVDNDYECCPMEGDLYLSSKGLNHSDFRIKTRSCCDIGCCTFGAERGMCGSCTYYECSSVTFIIFSGIWIILIMCLLSYLAIPTDDYLLEIKQFKELQTIVQSIHDIDVKWTGS